MPKVWQAPIRPFTSEAPAMVMRVFTSVVLRVRVPSSLATSFLTTGSKERHHTAVSRHRAEDHIIGGKHRAARRTRHDGQNFSSGRGFGWIS